MAHNLLRELIHEWFSNKTWWFDASSTDDEYIASKYTNLFDIVCDDTYYMYPLAYVILYDQIPRHIYRGSQSHHIITYFLEKALQILPKIQNATLSNEQWCFAMLPLRHTNNIRIIHKVMNDAWIRLAETQDDPTPIRRFLKATYERCPMENQTDLIQVNKSSECSSWSAIEFKEVLHNCPSVPCMKINKNNVVVRKVIVSFEQLTNTIGDAPMVMSLSGGVDSMVAFYIIHSLSQISLYRKTLSVVHINYCNRTTAYREEEFVTAWCNALGYDLMVRRIQEISRKTCMSNNLRNTYESYTRNVRYATYKNVNDDAVVILGHNHDDCLENIMQNISNQHKYDNLLGMDITTTQDGIMFFRPLINVSKNEIIRFAIEHNIPFLSNSTPTWSMRGQIRNTVIPVLDSWNPSFVSGLFTLSDVVADMYKIVDLSTTAIVTRCHVETPGFLVCDVHTNELHTSKLFWRMLFSKIQIDTKVSNRAITNFIERLTKWQASQQQKLVKVNLNKSFNMQFYHTSTNIIRLSFIFSNT